MKAKRANGFTRVGPQRTEPMRTQANGKALFVGDWNAYEEPRQVMTIDERHAIEHAAFMRANTTEALAREFGPWVKAADGSWFRDRSKRRRKR